jgi:hypothetical protein
MRPVHTEPDNAQHQHREHGDILHIGAEIVRLRDAADRLLSREWAQQRIRLIAGVLLHYGTLTGDEIGAMIAANA